MCTQPRTQSAIHAFKTHGVLRSTLHHALVNDFHIDSTLHDCLDSYFVRHWSGEFTFEQSGKGTGTITIAGNSYLVVFQNTTPFIVKNQSQVRLSFRKAKNDFNLCGYVIIRADIRNISGESK